MARNVTHFGKPLQGHDTLSLRFDAATKCSSGRAFYERFPAGDVASEEFVVPDGNILTVANAQISG